MTEKYTTSTANEGSLSTTPRQNNKRKVEFGNMIMGNNFQLNGQNQRLLINNKNEIRSQIVEMNIIMDT